MAFNITAADLKNRVQGLEISAMSVPNITVVGDIIQTAEALVVREAEAVGITNYVVGDDTYIILRSMAMYKAISEILVSRNRGNSDGVDWYITEYARLLGTLRHRPQSVRQGPRPQSVVTVTAGGTPGSEFAQDRFGYIRRVINWPAGGGGLL
jgi:hypothetical protein